MKRIFTEYVRLRLRLVARFAPQMIASIFALAILIVAGNITYTFLEMFRTAPLRPAQRDRGASASAYNSTHGQVTAATIPKHLFGIAMPPPQHATSGAATITIEGIAFVGSSSTVSATRSVAVLEAGGREIVATQGMVLPNGQRILAIHSNSVVLTDGKRETTLEIPIRLASLNDRIMPLPMAVHRNSWVPKAQRPASIPTTKALRANLKALDALLRGAELPAEQHRHINTVKRLKPTHTANPILKQSSSNNPLILFKSD